MQRITITIEDEFLTDVDRLVATRGYQNRSEAVRDLARAGMKQVDEKASTTHDCVGALVYVYAHGVRELSKRLTQRFHDHHDLSLAALHVHLDHDSCMEVTVLRGATRDVQDLASQIIAERGVRHGQLVTVPVTLETQKHPHGAKHGQHHMHVHVRDAN